MKFDDRTDPRLLSKWERSVQEAERERDEAIERGDYWKRELLSEQADYDKARAERDAAMRVITDFLAAMGVESGVPPSLEVVADAARQLVDTYEVLAAAEEEA